MLKKIFGKTIMTLILGGLVSSCAFHQGYMLNSAALSSNNFRYVKKDVSGSAAVTYVLGLGGLSKKALVGAAKKELLAASPLNDNQALANLTVNWKTSFVIPFVNTHQCTVTADIVEFK